jgi:hypothetical protein
MAAPLLFGLARSKSNAPAFRAIKMPCVGGARQAVGRASHCKISHMARLAARLRRHFLF